MVGLAALMCCCYRSSDKQVSRSRLDMFKDCLGRSVCKEKYCERGCESRWSGERTKNALLRKGRAERMVNDKPQWGGVGGERGGGGVGRELFWLANRTTQI